MDALTLSEIRMLGCHFAPRNTSTCAGQLMSIVDSQALFALLGTTYGGDGRTTYMLPDLRGVVPMGYGRGPGLTARFQGVRVGAELRALAVSQMPEHTHAAAFTPTGGSSGTPISATVTVNAKNGKGDQNDASGNYWATGEAKNGISGYAVESGYSSSHDTTMATDTVQVDISGGGGGITGGTVTNGITGGTKPFGLMQPSLGMNYVIALDGTFPARN
jgi:microcystin-dependent protein